MSWTEPASYTNIVLHVLQTRRRRCLIESCTYNRFNSRQFRLVLFTHCNANNAQPFGGRLYYYEYCATSITNTYCELLDVLADYGLSMQTTPVQIKDSIVDRLTQDTSSINRQRSSRCIKVFQSRHKRYSVRFVAVVGNKLELAIDSSG